MDSKEIKLYRKRAKRAFIKQYREIIKEISWVSDMWVFNEEQQVIEFMEKLDNPANKRG